MFTDTVETSDKPSATPFIDVPNKDYADWVRFNDLTDLESTSISMGPRYHLTSTQGRDVVIPVFTRGEVRSMSPGDPMGSTQDAYLIALDEQTGRVIGHRKFLISPAGDQALAVGTIVVRDKGSGIASTLELASDYHLRQLATELGKPIMQAVTNFNQKELDKLEKAYEDSGDETLLKAVTAKREEKKRWQALYGEKGKLGFDRDGFRTIYPDNTAVTPVGTDDIYIERGSIIDTAGRERIFPRKRDVGNATPSTDIGRRKELVEGIIPQIQAMLQN